MMRAVLFIGILIGGLMSGFLPALAQNPSTGFRTDTTEVRHFRIYYPINKIELYEHYMGNEHNLEVIRAYLKDSPRIDSIVIYSYASPEGPYEFNKWLARNRGETAKRYILSQVPAGREFPDSLIHLRPEAENWVGLRQEIIENYFEDDRNEVLIHLDSNVPDAVKKERLRRLNGGLAWRYILRHIMPKLRYATWISVWQPLPVTAPLQPVFTETPPPVPPRYVDIPREETKTILALKTNMLYDLVSWLNFSVEVPLYKNRFSLLYQHQFPWWRWGENNNEFCMRFLSIGGEVRWWFRPMPRVATSRRVVRDKFMGHYLGLYGMGGKWDFERKRDICYQGEFWSAGLSYGYAMPIGRRLNLEFSISAGYANIPYRHYTPTEDYSILIRDPEKHGTWHYFGLTKAEVSLVIPITVTKKRGGWL